MTIKPERLARIVLDFHPDDCQRLWPAFIGPTGCGKTTRVEKIAKDLGREVRLLLLGTMLPEDVLGLPYRPEKAETRTLWSLPGWAADCVENPGKYIVFLDEIDKARPEVLSTVLTLLAQSKVRDVHLPDTLFMCAGQPVPDGWQDDETTKAISARLVWIPVPDESAAAYVTAKRGMDYSFMGRPEPPRLPVLERPSWRQIDWASALLQSGVAREDEVRQILKGLMTERYVKGLLEAGTKVEEVSAAEAYHALKPEEKPGFLKALSPAERANLFPEVFLLPDATPQEWACAILASVADRDHDLRERAFKNFHDRVQKAAGKNKYIDVFPDTTPEEFVRILDITAACGIAVLENIIPFDAACKHIYEGKYPDLSRLK